MAIYIHTDESTSTDDDLQIDQSIIWRDFCCTDAETSNKTMIMQTKFGVCNWTFKNANKIPFTLR